MTEAATQPTEPDDVLIGECNRAIKILLQKLGLSHLYESGDFLADVVCSVTLACQRNSAAGESIRNLRSLIYRIAHNRIVTEIRAEKSREQRERRAAKVARSTNEDPSLSIDYKDFLEFALKQCQHHLRANHIRILNFISEDPDALDNHRKAAESLGLSYGTYRNCLVELRNAIRSLQQRGLVPPGTLIILFTLTGSVLRLGEADAAGIEKKQKQMDWNYEIPRVRRVLSCYESLNYFGHKPLLNHVISRLPLLFVRSFVDENWGSLFTFMATWMPEDPLDQIDVTRALYSVPYEYRRMVKMNNSHINTTKGIVLSNSPFVSIISNLERHDMHAASFMLMTLWKRLSRDIAYPTKHETDEYVFRRGNELLATHVGHEVNQRIRPHLEQSIIEFCQLHS
jgi:hypothetical protein